MSDHLDPGLQSERTALAWTRTSFGVAANAALLLRSGMVQNQLLLEVTGWALLVGAMLVYGVGSWRNRLVVERVRGGHTPTAPHLVAALAATTVLIAILVLVAVLVS